jgi:hypothetical protein
MLFDQLKGAALAAGLLLTGVCGGLAMTGSPDSPPGAKAPGSRPAADPTAALVKQLGSEDFARREKAGEELRRQGAKAEAALKAGLMSEDPEVRARCAKLLAAIRKDALDAFAKSFDPKAEKQPDHPVWNRFKAVAGDTRASRELFARIIKHKDWLARLDAAGAGPEAAAGQYQAAMVEVGRVLDSYMTVWFRIYVWPCDTADEAAYLLLLGSYPGAERAADEGEARHFTTGEHQLLAARGLPLGLQSKEIVPGPNHHYDETAALAPGSDRAFAKLLAAWLTRRNEQTLVFHGVRLAVAHRAPEVLPVARTLASGARSVVTRATALAAVAQFGEPRDLPLFEALFDESALVLTQEPSVPPGATPPPTIAVQVRDKALGLALLLCDRDPTDFGFTNAGERFRRENGRPVVAGHETIHFGFADDKARDAAHKKAKDFLRKRKSDAVPVAPAPRPKP